MDINAPTQASSDGLRSEPVYTWWDQVPSHLKTKTQLRAAGLQPGPERRAVIVYGRGRRYRCYELFDVHEAVRKRTPTAAQRAALEKAQRARRTCVECGAVKERPVQEAYGRSVVFGKPHNGLSSDARREACTSLQSTKNVQAARIFATFTRVVCSALFARAHLLQRY